MSLDAYGWEPFFERQLPGPPGTETGRVRLATARRVDVFAADRTVPVSLPRNVGAAAVGDWVLFDPKKRIATKILARRNALARNRPGHAAKRQVLAANIDVALIVAALDRDLRPRQIERYLTSVLASGAAPLIVLNKADQCPTSEEVARMLRDADARYPVVMTSATTGQGVDTLQGLLPERGTIALAGPSGAGKSSLINAMLQSQRLATASVRSQDNRGRHTTTRRELVVHPNGCLLMDMPGIRELYPWSTPEVVDQVFPEISGLGQDCYYRDCRHESEPGCSIRAAARDGSIDPGRLASFLELRREQEELRRSVAERHSGAD
ncbi:MAG: ribosome small subunit-dependent GTPase A [Bryobacterales bacterium]|nr:ribosome small subunit-dependent GTPase A [Bryobacterales bacterium]MDE0621948.1 ribosome small subunit-dependent GTPase A [Bryobacterales bacterium]